MTYFVTGATGFIGKRLVKKLLARRQTTVYFLVRKESLDKVPALLDYWGVSEERAVAVAGDLGKPLLGVSKADQKKLAGKIKHFFHLAAVYDLKADAESQIVANIEGTRNAVELANGIGAGIFQHVSSIAAAGMYEGVFREDMFDEAENLEHPYFATKHDSEKIVRAEAKMPWRVYRPGLVVGDSETGEMDKIDGPYYFFKLIQRMRELLPPWMPTIGIEGGRINIVPVDFVVDAIDHIAHAKEGNKKAFHIVDPTPYRVGDVLNIFARAAHAPQFTLRVNAALVGFIPGSVKKGLMSLTPVRRIKNAVMKDLGLPDDMLSFVNYPTRFDAREATAALKGTGISCPRLEDYAYRLWDYWERNLDPDLFIDRTLKGQVQGKVVVITGGSSGIGLAAAHKIAQAGATTVIIARDLEKLAAAKKEIEHALGDNENGGKVVTHSADLASNEGVDKATAWIIETFGGADFLVNNAGRSIRRGIESSYDRYHDFERTMQVNYFGALRMTMGLLPHMTAKRRGHIINISSIGVLTNAPRFSAYVASKAALDAWTACASSEFADVGIKFTTVNMPLVRTPMIAPTKLYQNVPTLSPEEAGDMIVRAIVDKPVRGWASSALCCMRSRRASRRS
jgi:NAD(P)-dependent dehydrogenase (short-subunit alcohol dehydrogenase family)